VQTLGIAGTDSPLVNNASHDHAAAIAGTDGSPKTYDHTAARIKNTINE
jgi:hypothetical protein